MSKKLSFDPIAEAGRQWRKRWGRAPVPAMTAITSVMRAQQIMLARLNGQLKPWGLTFPRYEALMLLYFTRTGSLPLGKIGPRLQVHPTSVTNLIDGLEKAGLVRREPHESDRRTTLASITEDGRRVAEEATATLNEDRFGTAPLTRDELDTLATILTRVRLDEEDFEPKP